MRLLDAATLRAWLETHYTVQLPGGTQTVIIGRTHPGLDSVLDHRPWYLLTPYNPRGRQLGKSTNRERLAAMNRRLEQMTAKYYPARHIDPAGSWPAEDGFLVGGLDRDAAVSLAGAFDQDGMVAGMPGGTAELWLLQVDLPEPLPIHVQRVRA